jgi:hypothetical protein
MEIRNLLTQSCILTFSLALLAHLLAHPLGMHRRRPDGVACGWFLPNKPVFTRTLSHLVLSVQR